MQCMADQYPCSSRSLQRCTQCMVHHAVFLQHLALGRIAPGRSMAIIAKARNVHAPRLQVNASDWRPHRLPLPSEPDWVQSLDLSGASYTTELGCSDFPPKILVLYGSLRARSFSRLLAYEFARVLEHLGAEVRAVCPMGAAGASHASPGSLLQLMFNPTHSPDAFSCSCPCSSYTGRCRACTALALT